MIVDCKVGVGTATAKLAEVYKKNLDFELAQLYYNNAINIFNNTNDIVRLAGVQLNLGEFYRSILEKEKAISIFTHALKNYENLNYQYGIAYAKGNIGLVYIAQNKLDSAEIYLNKSIEILEPLGDNYAVSSYLDGLAEVYFKRKQYLKAKQTSLKSLQLAQEYGLKEQMRDASLRLSTIYNQSKDFEKAFFHHKQYVAYRDSINNEETIRKIANLHTKYEVAQKQKEVDEQKSHKERYLIIAIGVTAVLVALLVLSIIIFRISRYRKKVNQKLHEQRRELTKANATKNKFFSVLSHDLRSPLSTFHSFSEVIDICAEHNEVNKVLEISKEMRSSSANLLDLLDNLLQWGITQMGSNQSVQSNVSVKDIVLAEKRHLQHVSDRKNIEVHVNIGNNITVFVDRVKFSMAIRNLLNNAIKFTPSEGAIRFVSEVNDSKIVLKISDTGVGMSKEQQKKLFNFSEITSTYGTQNEKGVGLGMQLIMQFIKDSRAKINVESEMGKGTTFILTFNK